MAEPTTVANKILEIAQAKGHAVTPLQLIKLVYLCHGWALAYLKRPLINENIEAWQYGPVIRSLYRKVKDFKNQPVEAPIRPLFSFNSHEDKLTNEEVELIQAVYNSYGEFSGTDLSNMTHQPDSPWDITWKNSGMNSVISNDLIQQHYDHLLRTRTSSNSKSD